MYSTTLSLTSALYKGEWLTLRAGRFSPSRESRYPLYRDWVRLTAVMDA